VCLQEEASGSLTCACRASFCGDASDYFRRPRLCRLMLMMSRNDMIVSMGCFGGLRHAAVWRWLEPRRYPAGAPIDLFYET
jgi:hypothetical protein